LQLNAHEACDTECDVGVAGEVAIDLQAECPNAAKRRNRPAIERCIGQYQKIIGGERRDPVGDDRFEEITKQRPINALSDVIAGYRTGACY